MNIRDQRGVVSLLAITLTSLLISIVTIGVVSQMTGELRQSTDAVNRVAAQFEAESGASDALAYLNAGLAGGYFQNNGLPNQTCGSADTVNTLTTGTDPAITCREVLTQGVAQGTLQRDGTAQFDLSGATVLDGGSLEIDWDTQRSVSGPLPRTFTSEPGISSGSSSWNGPPALEVTVAYNNGSTSPQTKSIYLLPQCCDGLAVPLAHGVPEDFNFIWSNNDTNVALEPTTLNCHAVTLATDYDCKAYLPGGLLSGAGLPPISGTTQYVVRIKALGGGGDYSLAMYNCGVPTSGCATVPLAFSNATIDVTTNVGGAYQRVVETPPVRSNPLGSTSYALVGTDNICKTLDLINESGGTYVPQFFPSCGNTDNSNP